MATQKIVSLLGISGSLRKTSSNTALLRALAQLVQGEMHLELFETLHALPPFNPDDDTDAPPPAVADFRARVQRADGLVISSPEYAHGVPGVLKNALDWLVSSFEIIHKPVALIDGAEGTEYLRPSLVETLRVMSVDLVPDAFLAVPLRGKKPAEVAALATSGETANHLRVALRALAAKIAARPESALPASPSGD